MLGGNSINVRGLVGREGSVLGGNSMGNSIDRCGLIDRDESILGGNSVNRHGLVGRDESVLGGSSVDRHSFIGWSGTINKLYSRRRSQIQTIAEGGGGGGASPPHTRFQGAEDGKSGPTFTGPLRTRQMVGIV